MCLLGNLTGRTPKKRRTVQSWSGRVAPNVASSFPVETEQHELEPEGTGVDELEPDEMAVNDEDGCDEQIPGNPEQQAITCGGSSSVQHAQLKDTLRSRGFQQRCHGPSASMIHSVWIFSRSTLQMPVKSFSATKCVGARCANCAFLSRTKLPLQQ